LRCPRRLPLSNFVLMRVACLIQGDSWVALNNLLATHNGASMITADLADQNVSPKIGDASLVIDGEEFAAHVVAHTESRIIFKAEHSDEIARKLSSTPELGKKVL
jgi:hypothetical protein